MIRYGLQSLGSTLGKSNYRDVVSGNVGESHIISGIIESYTSTKMGWIQKDKMYLANSGK